MKPGMPVLRSVRLLDQLRERIRYLHYSLSTGKAFMSIDDRVDHRLNDVDRHARNCTTSAPALSLSR
jgi:predicted DNA-binding protein